MGKKVKWFDTVQKILGSSDQPNPVEKETKKAAKSRDKPSFKKLWQLAKSSNHASTSAAPGTPCHQQRLPLPPPPSPPQPDEQQQIHHEIVREERSLLDKNCEQGDRVCTTTGEVATARGVVVAGHADTRHIQLDARSEENIAATRIQAACKGYLARRAHRERGMARLMELVEGLTVKRQTEEALYCMQTMTRVQTQIYSRRMKTEEDKKALKRQIKIKQSFDKTKIGEGWDHGYQSKEQMEAVLTMKQEAASRRERALAYAFSRQWNNRNPSSARAAPPPMFMDPGSPNWGWTWTERWMAAAKPWENQTTASGNGRATARSAGGRPRVAAITVPTPSTPGSRSIRPPSWPSLPFPSPRSPSVSGRMVVPASPRGSTPHADSGLQRTKSQQPDRQPRSSQQEQAVAVSTPRSAVPASPKRSGSPRGNVVPASPKRSGSPRGVVVPASPRRSNSPLHASAGGLQRPWSSQERAVSSPRQAGATATLLRTTSSRSEPPRRLRIETSSAAEEVSTPVTPSYMQATTSVRAKARCASPSPSSSPNKLEAPEKVPALLRAQSPSSAKKRQYLGVADKPYPSSTSSGKAERARPPSPRMHPTTT